MGCNCGKKNKQQRTQQQLQRTKTQQATIPAKDYVNATLKTKSK